MTWSSSTWPSSGRPSVSECTGTPVLKSGPVGRGGSLLIVASWRAGLEARLERVQSLLETQRSPRRYVCLKLRRRGVQSPFAGHPSEGVKAAVSEPKWRAGHEILYGARHEHSAGHGAGCYAGADMDGDSANVVVHDLALAAVKTSTDVEAKEPNGVPHRERAAHRSCRSIESRENAVTASVDLTTAVPSQLSTNDRA